jgi:hypothetical protein
MLRMTAVVGGYGAALAMLAVCGAPALAQQPQPPPAAGFTLPLGEPLPADSGKPRFSPTLADPLPASNCAVLLDCRLRAVGAVQRNGAVTLDATLFKW